MNNKLNLLILFLLLFTICFNFGYATLNRYDPRVDPIDKNNHRDPYEYYKMANFEYSSVKPPFRFRILIPSLAGLINKILSFFNFITWDVTLLSLLIINSFFVSLASFLLFFITFDLFNEIIYSLICTFIFITSFITVNCYLVALIDSGVVFFIILTIYLLLKKNYKYFPIIIILSVSIKETSLLYIIFIIIIWLIIDSILEKKICYLKLLITASTILIGIATIISIRKIVGGEIYSQHIFNIDNFYNLPINLIKLFISKSFIYTFFLLLPLAFFNLKEIPIQLIVSTIFLSIIVILACSYSGIGGENFSRPLFNVISPLLTISTSIYIGKILNYLYK